MSIHSLLRPTDVTTKRYSPRWFIWWARQAVRHPVPFSIRCYNDFIKQPFYDLLARLGIINWPYKIIYIAGLGGSGSSMTKEFLGQVPGYFHRRIEMPVELRKKWGWCDEAFKHCPPYAYSIFKTHTAYSPEVLECLWRNGVKKVVVTYRDIRDIPFVIYHRQYDYPKNPDDPLYIDLKSVSFEQGIDHFIEASTVFRAKWIEDWWDVAVSDPKRFHLVKFEAVKQNPLEEFQKMLDFYEISLPEKKLRKMISNVGGFGGGFGDVKKNLEAMAILPYGSATNFRKGKSGYWKRGLTPRQVDRCKELFGDLLIKMGYEKDLNWDFTVTDPELEDYPPAEFRNLKPGKLELKVDPFEWVGGRK